MKGYRHWSTVPLQGRPLISVVIPAYNEEWRILPTIGAIAHEMAEREDSFEMIVSDDGSSDDTKRLVAELNLPNLVLIESENTGKGGAVRRGALAARGDYILFADADQSTPIQQFDALFAPLEAGTAQVAIGSRGADGAEVANKSLKRKILSQGLNSIVRIGFGIKQKDTQCGFKLFTREAAHDLFGRQRIDGFSFDLELLFLANRQGYTVAEIPVEWIDAPGSTVDAAKVAVQFLKDLVTIRLRSLRGGYRNIIHQPAELSAATTTMRSAA